MTEPAKQVDQPISVLIIGFGISSISATHTFISNGFKKVTVIEASKELGGVWNSAHNHHPTLVANNTRHTFEFPELRHNPDLYNDFPTQEQVNSYLQQYVEDFDLEKYVHYDTKVQKLSRRKKSEDHNWVFDVVFSKPVNGSTHSSFEFVVISTGSNHKPHIPIGLSSDLAPKGVMTLHSSKVRYQLAKDSHLFQDKNVVVVGASKSGQDISVLAAELGATQVTLVGGMTHWFPPRYFGGDDSSTGQFNEEVLYNRVSSAMLPGNPEALIYNGSIVPKALYFFQSWRVGKMLRNAFWTKTQSDIATQVSSYFDQGKKERFLFLRSIYRRSAPPYFLLLASCSVSNPTASLAGKIGGRR